VSVGVFHFFDWFQGPWTVQRSTILLKTSEVSKDDTLGHYKISKKNGTELVLVGTSWDNETGEITNRLDLSMEFDTLDKGVFRFGSVSEDGEEENFQTLFSFDFVEQGEQNSGLFFSSGIWTWSKHPHSPQTHKDGTYLYQFWVTLPDRFILTIQSQENNKDWETVMYAGRKVPTLVERSFFSKYGTIIMIVGLFLTQFVLKGKMAPQAAPQGTSARAKKST